MKKFLLTTSAIVALATTIQSVGAADFEAIGNVDFPTTFISFEGGFMFDASPSNASFPEESEPCIIEDISQEDECFIAWLTDIEDGQFDEDDKLGGLGSLNPGQAGAQGRFELGQRLNNNWDYKVGLGALYLSEDTSSREVSNPLTDLIDELPSFGESEASQSTDIRILDFEVGYRPDDFGALQTRLFAGVRGLHSVTEVNWNSGTTFGRDGDKVGEFQDSTYAIGPRIGADLALPLDSSDVALVGSMAGSVLFGKTETEYQTSGGLLPIGNTVNDWNDSAVIWNVEGMAGVSFGIGENADLTLGYRAAQYSGLMMERSDINKVGEFSDDGRSDLLVHGPFARLTVEIP
jgi:hypothetical protein